MTDLRYPSKRFLNDAIDLIVDGEDIRIQIGLKKNISEICRMIERFSSDDGFTFFQFLGLARVFKLSGICFCAVGAGYSVSIVEENGASDILLSKGEAG